MRSAVPVVWQAAVVCRSTLLVLVVVGLVLLDGRRDGGASVGVDDCLFHIPVAAVEAPIPGEVPRDASRERSL
ncbi:hypothetical protein [Streptomyces sp. NPDC002467]|uniref:hypothetical protein n=1 Tax=Streptomyces sp. NPDC002467 TaxID=3364647 RepID=UPI0036A833E2